MPPPTPNLKFRCLYWSDHIPNGYRWATVEEVRTHSDTIARLGIPSFTKPRDPIQGGKKMYLLDGYMTYPSHDGFRLEQTFERSTLFGVMVQERERDGEQGRWRSKSSACYPSDGRLLRRSLYHHIALSPQARQIALLYAISYLNVEALYWLLSTSSSEELGRFKLSFNSEFGNDNFEYYKMVKCLLSSKFPFQLPLELDSDGNTATHYTIQFGIETAKYKDTSGFDILLVDLFVELFSTEIVHWKESEGKSFLDMAHEGGEELTGMFTKLLSVSQQPLEDHLGSIKPRFQAVLFEAVKRGYLQLVENMFKNEAMDVSSLIDEDEKSLLHYAAESGNPDIFQLLLTSFDIFQLFLTSFDSFKSVDKFGENIIHCAAKGKIGLQIVEVLAGFIGSPPLDLMKLKDNKGRTPLHIASSKGNKEMVDKLLALLEDEKYVKDADYFGRTALHMASCGGHEDVVKMLLQKAEWNLVEERDVKGKTALHYAAKARDPEDAVAICRHLLQSCESEDTDDRSLLLWASAGSIGTADEGEAVNPLVKTFLEGEKASHETNLLREAAIRGNVEMAWELLNRGADIDDLRDPQWEKKSHYWVTYVLHQLELLREQGRDQPSREDKLGRNAFAEGLAALFLNRFIESPITVGICGEWGMGKSSLMIQTEIILLMTAAQLTFPNLLKSEKFGGAKEISLSRKGRKIYETIRKGAFSLLVPNEDKGKIHETIRKWALSFLIPKEDKSLFFKICDKIWQLWKNFVLKEKGPLVKMLKEYKPEYHSIYKSLACMDTSQMLDSQQSHSLAGIPRILTVQYNAWQYYDQHEAWAGLAVTISKEIEKSMTRAQWFSTGWRYSWNKNNVSICFQVLLPCFIAAFLAGWIGLGAWILLKEGKFQALKYGSIPLTIMTTIWIVFNSILSVVKPVSVQMMGYITSPDHTSHLGYQEQVISDINFLKRELGNRPHRFFSLILGEWCWNWFGLYSNNVENTSIMKFKPASEDQLRIITFVDDLDRCEEKVILQVLSAVNLVLARCQINVVLGIDKIMIESAIKRSFENVEDVDLADKFMCKIIQIPLSLPDPTENQMNNFLQYQFGCRRKTRSSFRDDADYGTSDYGTSDYGTSDDDVEDANNKGNTALDIDCEPLPPRCQGIIGKVRNWLSCKISSERQQPRDQLDDSWISIKPPRDQPDDLEMYPLTFSEGPKLIRDMVISKYTEEEADTFENLKRFVTGNRKLPREWKRLFNYHRLAWNVLTKRGEVHKLPTWKVELVAWIFVCWQWKHEMNIVIKGWRKYIASIESHGSARGRHGPGLSQIVKTCASGKSKEAQGKGKAKEHVEGQAGSIVEEDPFQNSWANLQEALTVQDVSMKGIQLFQLFRLHCDTDHLPWPLPNHSKPK